MNNKMSSEETLSITAWEKSHPAEVAACDKGIRLEIDQIGQGDGRVAALANPLQREPVSPREFWPAKPRMR
jgi:hypothetical protein